MSVMLTYMPHDVTSGNNEAYWIISFDPAPE